MTEHLGAAFALAGRVRYSGDSSPRERSIRSVQANQVHYQFNQTGLRVSADMMPSIHRVFVKVCDRLAIDFQSVNAYVYASPELQAGCYSGDSNECFVSIASGLIDLMSEEEVAFVLGHEIGHFLCGHGRDVHKNSNSTESLIQQRSQEISADRLGMIGAGAAEPSYRALIKITAGLPDRLLRFDIGTFLDQIRRGGKAAALASASTHPSLVMRCRALLWFSMSDEFGTAPDTTGGIGLAEIDSRVEKDMAQFVDGPARERIKDAKRSTELWLAVAATIRDGSFDKEEQQKIADLASQEALTSLLGLFRGRGRDEVIRIVKEKLVEAEHFYMEVAPGDYKASIDRLKDRIGTEFKQKDFVQYVSVFVGQESNAHNRE